MVDSNNLAGHRKFYDALKAKMPADKFEAEYVGGGDPLVTGHREAELIKHYVNLDGATVVDVGCGIGRLTRYIAREPVARYVGTDIIPEVLETAEGFAPSDRFEFYTVSRCEIPVEDESADCVCGFSVLTHLLDEEIHEYMVDTSRVLKSGGKAIYSFFDFGHPDHQVIFNSFARNHRHRPDVLKFIERSTLSLFASQAGLTVAEFITPGTRFDGPFPVLLDGRDAPPFISFGQAVAVFEKP
jgi:SAM-dependent methyltransferase